jgi:hypothetical protein
VGNHVIGQNFTDNMLGQFMTKQPEPGFTRNFIKRKSIPQTGDGDAYPTEGISHFAFTGYSNQ